MLCCHVVLFAQICIQIIELHFGVSLPDVGYDSFPFTHSDGFIADFRVGIFPVKILMFLLSGFVAEQGRQETDAVGGRTSDGYYFGKCRHDVLKTTDMVGFRTGLDFVFPHHDGRDADAAFVQEAFAPTIFGLEPAAAVEPRRVAAAIKGGAVVGSKNNQGVVIQVFCF